MAMAVGMTVPWFLHMFHDFIGPFDVMISFVETGVHSTGMMVRMGVHHGWMVVARKKSEHAFHSLHGDLGLISSTVH